MKLVRLPDSGSNHKLVFFLAVEEYLANIDDNEFFFLWQSDPTVIIGRNQILKAEVNEEFCRCRGIDIFRRKSGGGCVYSDPGNLMISYITSKKNSQEAFGLYLDRLATAIGKLGIKSVKTINNDLLADSKKISGNASYITGNSNIVHGTLLYDMNFDNMTEAITPSVGKIYKHGIKSVRQRVVNLKELKPDLSLEEIKKVLLEEFCDDEFLLTDTDLKRITEIEKSYLDMAFIMGTDE